jgi:glutamyl-tRNA synthetase
MNQAVRVRFAPSPTGYVHVGSLRAALYNYLFARRHGGTFVLRIEDTDQTRYVPGAVENLISTLRWAGLAFDEGPEVGGAHAPYFQSQRTELYRQAADRLLAGGQAYRCFCTAERLAEMRTRQQKEKLPQKYDRTCLSLSREEAEARETAGEPHVVRLLVPEGETVRISDLVRGEVEFESEQIDDQVLLKSDGFPTYHLANVVDDHLMKITHVIRGEEWLSSTPKHVLLYKFLGCSLPQFAHLPLLLNADRSKLSKRQGDVAVEAYREAGFYPEAVLNFVAFLGWNPGDEREVFSLPDLVREFSLERVNKSGAIFNLEKLRWMNGEYLRARSPEQLAQELRPHLQERGWADVGEEYLVRVCTLMRERVIFVREIPEKAGWFFAEPQEYEAATVSKRWKPESAGWLRGILPRFETVPAFDTASLHLLVETFAAESGGKVGDLVHPLRLACTGVGAGPGLYELMETLGREQCLARIRRTLEILG